MLNKLFAMNEDSKNRRPRDGRVIFIGKSLNFSDISREIEIINYNKGYRPNLDYAGNLKCKIN